MYTKEQQAECLTDFVKGFTTFMDDNPETLEIFSEAWHNADNITIRDIVIDYIMELEAQNQ
jgi:hypothetical protein